MLCLELHDNLSRDFFVFSQIQLDLDQWIHLLSQDNSNFQASF